MTFNEILKDWLTTFWKVLISPTPKTFATEARKAEGKFSSAMAWLVVFTVYVFIFSVFIFHEMLITGFIGMVLVFPLTVILFSSAVNFFHQRVFKKKQYIYDQLIYLNTAILLPIQFLFIPLSILVLLPTASITLNAIVSDIVLFYQFILIMVAFQSISGLRFWQAAIAVTISVFAAGIILMCIIPFVLSMIGGVNTTVR